MSFETSTFSVPSSWRGVVSPPLPRIRELELAATREVLLGEPLRSSFGRFEVRGELGRGGMSTVYEAYDPELGRLVALKVLRHDLAARHGERLRREARALAKLSHVNVVQVFEVGKLDGLTFLVMELVPGQTLRRWQEEGPRSRWRERVAAYLQAGRGLAAAHAVGLVHRDFKPDNCMIDAEGRVRVLDFGLVTHGLDEETLPDGDAPLLKGTLDAPLTRTGALMGTVAYMPPERLLRRTDGDAAAGDQFSFCTALYEALHGERPFAGRSAHELAVAIEQRRMRSVARGVGVPAAVRRIVLRGLAAEPGERWSGMAELIEALERHLAPPMRRWSAGVAVAGTLAAAFVGGGLRTDDERGSNCAGSGAQLDGVWDEARRRAVERAIIGAGSSYAVETWARVEPALDDYAQRWVVKQTEVCEATRVTGMQTEADMSLRMHCLSGRRIALREAVGVLMQADETTREHAVALVGGLPGLSQCDDLEALKTEVPLPRDPSVVEAVADARARLARARAWREAGAHAQGEAEASAVIAEAEQLGEDLLLTEALLERGEARVVLERPREAEADLERAHHLAQRVELRDVETRAASLLARVVLEDPLRLDQAEQWGESAWSLAQRRGSDRLLTADSARALGHVRLRKGWLENDPDAREEALQLHRRSLVHYENALGSQHPALAEALEAIGDVLLRQKKAGEALERYEEALVVYEAALGESHPAVAVISMKVGEALVGQEEPALALPLYERALAIQQAAYGPWHASVAHTQTRLGIALHRLGRLDEALALHRDALESLDRAPDRERLAVIGILSEIGFVRRDEGRMMEAVDSYDRSILVREAVKPRQVATAYALFTIGEELLSLRLLDAAEEHYRRALAAYEAAFGPRHGSLAFAKMGLGEVELWRGNLADAVRHAEQALAIRESSGDTTSVLVARIRFLLARGLWADPGERGRARREAEAARECYLHHGEGSEELAEVEEWLAVGDDSGLR